MRAPLSCLASFAVSVGAVVTYTSEASAPVLHDSLMGNKYPELCHPALVQEGCLAFNQGRETKGKTSPNSIGETLSANQASVARLLKHLGLEVQEQEHVRSISCMELCRHLERSFSRERLPPVSDVGCRADTDGGGSPICDIDLSPEALEAIHFPERNQDGALEHDGNSGGPEQEAPKAAELESFEEGDEVDELPPDDIDQFLMDVPVEDAKTRLANTFRIYPMLDVKVSGNV